jgi:hypothetical protein
VSSLRRSAIAGPSRVAILKGSVDGEVDGDGDGDDRFDSWRGDRNFQRRVRMNGMHACTSGNENKKNTLTRKGNQPPGPQKRRATLHGPSCRGASANAEGLSLA